MVVKFLSKVSGKFMPLQRQRSSNSITSYKSSTNSTTSTPKHMAKTSTLNSSSVLLNDRDKSSCFKSEQSRNKKLSRVEFDFSYQKCNDSEMIKFCPKHNCCNQVLSSSSSNMSNPIEIPKQQNSNHLLNAIPMTSKSFSIYETLNRAHNDKKMSTCQNSQQKQTRRGSLDLMKESSQSFRTNENQRVSTDEKVYYSGLNSGKIMKLTQNNSQSSYNKKNIDLDSFNKSANKKVSTRNVSTKNSLWLEMKERIAQAETFLEAMGSAGTPGNRDSSRYVRQMITAVVKIMH